MGSQLEGSAEQKNCVSRPILTMASSTAKPFMRDAAFQVAPHGAPRMTEIFSTFPLLTLALNSGNPNSAP